MSGGSRFPDRGKGSMREGGSSKSKLPPWKTVRCWNLNNGGRCQWGDNCHFAHSAEELEMGQKKLRETSERSDEGEGPRGLQFSSLLKDAVRQKRERRPSGGPSPRQQPQSYPQSLRDSPTNLQRGRVPQLDLQSQGTPTQTTVGSSVGGEVFNYGHELRGPGSGSPAPPSEESSHPMGSRVGTSTQPSEESFHPTGSGMRTPTPPFEEGSNPTGNGVGTFIPDFASTSGFMIKFGDFHEKRPLETRHEENLMDPSNVLKGNDPPIPKADNEMSLLDFVMYRCQNVFRVSDANNATYTTQRKEMQEVLKIYEGYNLGVKALLPSRPAIQTKLQKCPDEVFANHFQINFQPEPEYRLYTIAWTLSGQPSATGTFMGDRNRSWWQRIIKEHGKDPKGLNNIQPAYDGGSMLVCHQRFAWTNTDLTAGVNLTLKNTSIAVKITLRFTIDLENYAKFTSNSAWNCIFPKDVVQVMNIIMRQYCVTKGYIESGRFYFNKTDQTDLDSDQGPDMLISKSGYFQSVRVLGRGLTLNVDAMSTAFYKPGKTLSETWDKMQNFYVPEEEKRAFWKWTLNSIWTEEQARIATRFWKNLIIKSTHKGQVPTSNEQFTIFQVTNVPAEETLVTGNYDFQGKTRSYEGRNRFQGDLITFMGERYNQENNGLMGHMPAIKVSKKNDFYLPWGCCETTDASRYAGKIEQYNSRLLTKLERSPKQRHDVLKDWMANRFVDPGGLPMTKQDNRPWAEKEFNVSVSREMMKVEALVLETPQITVLRGSGREGEEVLNYHEKTKSFRIRDYNSLLKPARVTSWVFLAFDSRSKPGTETFLQKLAENKRGVALLGEPIKWTHIIPNHYAQRRHALRATLQEIKEKHPTVGLIICIMARKLTPEYATLKYECDQRLGVPTQVVIGRNIEGKDHRNVSRLAMLVDNLLLKINVKCGGENFRVLQDTMSQIKVMKQESRTILLGADVTHGFLSIAAVVATTDSSAVNYASRIKPQRPKQEKIEHLREMVEELFDVYFKQTKEWPLHIIFFRDGVSETQFVDTLRYEGTAILQAAHAKNPAEKPKLLILLAVKRHHTRFFKKIKVKGNEGVDNISEGTVITQGVTHPREHEFYLCSQAPLKGTSRATKYHVLLDQIQIDPDELYMLVYYLCFSFQRCFKSVALVTPVYYAHLAAFRAKLYLECYVAQHPMPQPKKGESVGEMRNRMREWLDLALDHNFNAHPTLQNRLWYL